MNHDEIGRSIRTLRQKKEWTLEELSSRCGLSMSFLSQVERGLSSLSISSLGTICDALEVPVTYFFTARGDGPVVHKADQPRWRIRIEDSQVTYNLLSARMPDRVLEAFIAGYPPHYEHPLVTPRRGRVWLRG
jgi:transcriptional regulator with XRE-family HTH domain